MWKKYMASLGIVVVLTPVFSGALYLQQNYSAKISKKVATAASVETFERQSVYPLLNQASPFQKMPANVNDGAPEAPASAPLKPYIPVPSSPPSFAPGAPLPPNAVAALPSVKSVIWSGDSSNVAILSDGSNDIMVEVGQATRWGSIDDITPEGVYINGTLYKTKVIM